MVVPRTVSTAVAESPQHRMAAPQHRLAAPLPLLYRLLSPGKSIFLIIHSTRWLRGNNPEVRAGFSMVESFGGKGRKRGAVG